MDPVVETLTAVRLDTRSRARGSDPAQSSVGAFLFGLPFIGGGLWLSWQGSAQFKSQVAGFLAGAHLPFDLMPFAEPLVGGIPVDLPGLDFVETYLVPVY